MKIEKLTDNKIRIIINLFDLESENINIHHLNGSTLEEQSFFIKMLEKAKKEVGFETNGCKLLIEILTSNEEFLVFTITKCTSSEKKKPIVKRKITSISETNLIYKFNDFEEFCMFCICVNKFKSFNSKLLSKSNDLYNYQNTYYLIIKNIYNNYINKVLFLSIISEFSEPVSFSNAFENKLKEYGNIIIKKNAIEKGIKYFV